MSLPRVWWGLPRGKAGPGNSPGWQPHEGIPGARCCQRLSSPQRLTESRALFRVLRLFLQTEQLEISLPSNRLLVANGERMEGWIGSLRLADANQYIRHRSESWTVREAEP